MLRVPAFQDSVRSQPLRDGGRPRVIDNSGAIVRGLGDVARTAQAINQRNAQLESEEKLQEYITGSNTLLFTGDTPYYGRRGKDAVEGSAPTLEALNGLKRSLVEQTKNPTAREMLSRSIDSRLLQERQRIATRAMDGQKEWDKALATTGIEQAAENVSLYITEPDKVSAAEVALQQQYAVLMEGMPLETRSEAVETTLSKALSAGIGKEIERSPGRAEAMMQRYGDKIEPQDKAKLNAKLNDQVDMQMTQAATNDIRRAHPGDLKAQIKVARETFEDNPALQKKLKSAITNEYNLDTAVRQEAQRKSFEYFANQIRENGLSITDIPYEHREHMTNAQMVTLEGLVGRGSKKMPIATDWNVWNQLVMNTTQAELAQPGFSPMLYRNSLSDKHFEKLQAMVKEARSGDSVEHTYLQTNAAFVKSSITTLPDETQQQAYDVIEGLIHKKEEEVDRKINRPELRDIVNEYFMQRNFLNRNMFFPDTMTETSIAETTIENVPPSAKVEIEQELQKRGKAATEAEVLYWFKIGEMRKARAKQQIRELQ